MVRLFNLASRLVNTGSSAYKNHLASNDKGVGLEVYNAKQCYTSGDTIRGRVVIDFPEATAVSEITVKLKCDISTRLIYEDSVRDCPNPETGEIPYFPAGKPSGRDGRLSSSHDRIYREEVRVFPTADLARTSAKNYTIAAGEHSYEFEITFPDYPEPGKYYPPTVTRDPVNGDESYYKCEHVLKVTVQRASSFCFNPRAERRLAFVPRFDQEGFQLGALMPASKSFTLNEKIFVDAQVVLPRNGLPQAPSRVPLQLAVKATHPILVRNVYLSLEGKTRWFSRDPKRRIHAMGENVNVIIGKLSVNRVGVIHDLSDSLLDLVIGDYIVPSFQQNLLKVSYDLIIGISVGNDSDAFGSEILEFRIPVKVLPPMQIARSGSSVSSAAEPVEPVWAAEPVHTDLPPAFDEKAQAAYASDLKSGQKKRPYLPAYQ